MFHGRDTCKFQSNARRDCYTSQAVPRAGVKRSHSVAVDIDALGILGINVTSVMERRHLSVRDMSERSGIPTGTVGRAKLGSTPLRLDYVEKLARAVGLEPWQLLCPGLDPDKPPAPPTLSVHATNIALQIDRISDPTVRAQKMALIEAILNLSAPPPSEQGPHVPV